MSWVFFHILFSDSLQTAFIRFKQKCTKTQKATPRSLLGTLNPISLSSTESSKLNAFSLYSTLITTFSPSLKLLLWPPVSPEGWSSLLLLRACVPPHCPHYHARLLSWAVLGQYTTLLEIDGDKNTKTPTASLNTIQTFRSWQYIKTPNKFPRDHCAGLVQSIFICFSDLCLLSLCESQMQLPD